MYDLYVTSSPCISGETAINLRQQRDLVILVQVAQMLNKEQRILLSLCRAIVLAVLALCGVGAVAQTRSVALMPDPNASGVNFEVATIKPSSPEHVGFQSFVQGDRYTAMTAPLRKLIGFAYHIQDFQISGGPTWSASDPYDITAKMNPAANPDQVRFMLQSLLEDRFHLKLHRAIQKQTGYALVLDKNGPKLVESKEDGLGLGLGRGHLTGMGASTEMLANELSSQLESPVADRTGLKGFYNFKLTWTPDDQTTDASGLSIFSALREQIGLKLVPVRDVSVDMVVIDHIERPSEN